MYLPIAEDWDCRINPIFIKIEFQIKSFFFQVDCGCIEWWRKEWGDSTPLRSLRN